MGRLAFLLLLAELSWPGFAHADFISPFSTGTYEKSRYQEGYDPTVEETHFLSRNNLDLRLIAGESAWWGTTGPISYYYSLSSAGVFELGALTPGDPVVLSFLTSLRLTYADDPTVFLTLFGTNDGIQESDFTGSHSLSTTVLIHIPPLWADPTPELTFSVDITSFAETVSGAGYKRN